MAGGGYGKDNKDPLLIASFKGGKNWSVMNIDLPEDSGQFTNITSYEMD